MGRAPAVELGRNRRAHRVTADRDRSGDSVQREGDKHAVLFDLEHAHETIRHLALGG